MEKQFWLYASLTALFFSILIFILLILLISGYPETSTAFYMTTPWRLFIYLSIFCFFGLLGFFLLLKKRFGLHASVPEKTALISLILVIAIVSYLNLNRRTNGIDFDHPLYTINPTFKGAVLSPPSTQSANYINFRASSQALTSEMLVVETEVGLEPWQVCLSPGELFGFGEVLVTNDFEQESKKFWYVREDGMAIKYTGRQRNVNATAICHSSGTELREYIDEYLSGHIEEEWMDYPEKGFKCACLEPGRADQKCCLIALRNAR